MFLLSFAFMNFVTWNCRGASAPNFPGIIKDSRKQYCTSFIALLETRTSGNKAKRIINKMGFDSYFIVEAQGFAGGIWCMWDLNAIIMKPLSHSDQHVSLEVKGSRGLSWTLTVIYGSP